MKTPSSTMIAISLLYALAVCRTTAFVPTSYSTVGVSPLFSRSNAIGTSMMSWGKTGRKRSLRNSDSSKFLAIKDVSKQEHGNANKIHVTSEEFRIRNLEQLQKLRSRDRQSLRIAPGDLQIVYEDKWLVCVNKPAGVLCVPSEEGIPTLAQTVFETVDNKQTSLDRMVVHRLGMDTSGLVLFAKTMESLRELNTLFRTRKIERRYEVLVCGHVAADKGTIDLPLMRDYAKPPFMRISTDEHQTALLDLNATIVGKKLLESPKDSQTNYEVISRETFQDTNLPVTRLLLTSVTGRTHQLNVHMAAIGHPIVGDKVYGFGGDAVPNGGLELDAIQNDVSASRELQEAIANVATRMCVHAKSLSFLHPMKPLETDPIRFECRTSFIE